jgi:hypothetical protein
MLCLLENTQQHNLVSDGKKQETESGYFHEETEQLGLYDVICGRHKAAMDNIGNRRFRVTVALSLARYKAAFTRKEKSIIIHSVAAIVRSNGGRFLQRYKGTWAELDDKMAHEKVGHALRDMAGKPNSSKNASAYSIDVSPSATLKDFAARWQFPSHFESTTVASEQDYSQSAPMENADAPGEPLDEDDEEGNGDYDYEDFTVSNEQTISADDESTQASIKCSLGYWNQQMQLQPHAQQQYTDESLLVSEFEDSSDFEQLLLQNHEERGLSLDDNMISWMIGESNTLSSGLETH